MRQYVLQRLVQLLPVLLGVSLVSFLLLHIIPGDPAEIYAGDTPLGVELVAQIRQNLGLDRPLHVQYLDYVWRALHGDFGTSMRHRGDVLASIMAVFPNTLQLTLAAVAFTILIGVPLGVLAATRSGTWLDVIVMAIAMLGVSLPSFFLGLLLIMVFSFQLGWLPATGAEGWQSLVMPAFTLGFSAAAVLARLVRSSMLEVLRQDYVVTARSKGLSPRSVIWGHAMRNALIPAVTMIGLQVGFLLGGAVTTEIVFSRPGIGRLLVISIGSRDYTMAQGLILFSALLFVASNLIVDLTYALIDPRIRYE